MDQDLDAQLKELIVERLFLDMEPSDIESETPLAEYGIDSFLLMELTVAIEEIFEVRFEPTDINADTLRSVATLRECVKAKRAATD